MSSQHYPERGFVNILLYSIDQAPALDSSSAVRLVDAVIDGGYLAISADETAEAIDAVLRRGHLHPQNLQMSRRYSEAELLGFLRLVKDELDRRRPWPRPRLRKLDVSAWQDFAAARPVARIARSAVGVRQILRKPFDTVPVGQDELPVMVLELRSGDVVALVGSVDPAAKSHTLLARHDTDPTGVIARFCEHTGFSPAEVVPLDPPSGRLD